MTPLQKKTLGFIRNHIVDNGYSPSYEEIRVATRQASKSGVARLIDALVRHGCLTKVLYGHRSIRLLNPTPEEVLSAVHLLLTSASRGENGTSIVRSDALANLRRIVQ